jgi:hypothetical protein
MEVAYEFINLYRDLRSWNYKKSIEKQAEEIL